MRVCSQCGKHNICHLPRHVSGRILCAHEYEDIIANLKNQLKNAIRPEEYQNMLKAAQARNETIHRRNRMIKDMQKKLELLK